MELTVWMREIWDTRDLAQEMVDPSGNPRWDRMETRVDPEDMNALEMALQIAERVDGRVHALSVGEPRQVDVLKEALYRGVDSATRLGDERCRGNIWAEARLVSAAVERLNKVDLVLTGSQVNEGEGPQKAALVAAFLGWPLVSYVEAFEEPSSQKVLFRRAVEGGVQKVSVRFPAVISVGVALLKDDPRAPRSAKAKLKLQHKRTAIPCWDAGALGLEGDEILDDLTPVVSYRGVKVRDFPSRRVEGSDEKALRAMLKELSEEGILR